MKVSPVTRKICRPVSASSQKKLDMRDLFTVASESFFCNSDNRTYMHNKRLFVNIIKTYCKSGVDENQVQTFLQGISGLLKKKKTSEKINLINVMYSLIIKKILPDTIINGDVLADTYRYVIENSIQMYKNYPLGQDVDLRHIMGRMVSLKDMSSEIYKRFQGIPRPFAGIKWSQDNQIEFIKVLEIIMLHYNKVNASFVSNIAEKQGVSAHNDEFKKEVKANYYRNIQKLLCMLCDSSKNAMSKNPPDIEEVEECLETAEFYYNKIPYSEISNLPKLPETILKFVDIRKQLKSEIMHKSLR